MYPNSDPNRLIGSSRNENNQPKIKRYVYKAKTGDVELHSESLECLKPGCYLKDNIIQFYLSYLITDVCPNHIASRVHIFDSIFTQQLDKLFSSDHIDKVKWAQLSKWYSNVDLFEKDFLIFPRCQKDHWYTLVVCYPRSVRPIDHSEIVHHIGDDDDDNGYLENLSTPGIIVMDSLALRGPSMTSTVRDFLDHNWRNSASDEVKRFSHSDLKDYFPRLPRQRNDYDCGLYMLMYIRTFLEDPDKFYTLSRRTDFESRSELKRRVRDLLPDNDREKLENLIVDVCDRQT